MEKSGVMPKMDSCLSLDGMENKKFNVGTDTLLAGVEWRVTTLFAAEYVANVRPFYTSTIASDEQVKETLPPSRTTT